MQVLKEAGYNGFKADVWSCGVILFVMLAGYLPFSDNHMNKLFMKINNAQYKMSPHFSEGLKNLIPLMLCADPNKRITMAEVVRHPWFLVNLDLKEVEAVDTVRPQQVDSQELSDALNQTPFVTVE